MKAREMALGGILVSLALITLYLTYIIPTNTLAILCLSSIFVPIAIIRGNTKTGLMVYVASSLISLFLIPINYSIMYCLLFGGYGLVKYFLETKKNRALEIILKLIFFNIVFTLGIILIKYLGTDIRNTLALPLLYGIGNVVFLIYDYALSTLISLYYKRFHKL